MSHENNRTNFFRNKKGMKVWYNEPTVKASKHPTKLNPERVVFKCKILKAKIEKEPDSKYCFRIVKVLDE